MKTKLTVITFLLTLLILGTQSTTAQTNWIKYVDNPVIENSNDQAWNRWFNNPTVIVTGDSLRMWYRGTNQAATIGAIGHAYSNDGGETWTIDDEPEIPSGSNGDWNKHRIPNTVLLTADDTLRMWYNASSGSFNYNSTIGYAKRYKYDSDWILIDHPVLKRSLPKEPTHGMISAFIIAR